MRKFELGTLVAAALAAGAMPAFAGCDIPFQVTTGASLNGAVSLQCSGPWFRASSCITLSANENQQQFYCAENTTFSPKGAWGCSVSRNACSSFVQNVGVTNFCVNDDSPVELTVTGTAGPTVNKPLAGPNGCSGVSTTAFLGRQGNQDGAGAAESDTYVWRGQGGAPLTVRLVRDGTGGSAGSRARLGVLGEGGNVLGQDAGRLPLRVTGTVPAGGLFRIVVSEAQQGEGGPADDAFRGSYRLAVQAAGIRKDRTLEPLRDVEP